MRKGILFVMLAMLIALFTTSALAQPSGAGVISDLHANEDASAETDAEEGPAVEEEAAEEEPASEEEEVANEEAEEEAADDEEAAEDEASEEEPEPTIGEIAEQGKEAIDIWKTQGWVAGLAAIIFLLVQITKVGFIKGLLGVRKWLRPLIAVVLGCIGAVLASIAGGVVWYNAVGGALVAALSAPGFSELLHAATSKGRAKRTETEG
jgi:hypothetical protein